ncbi:hypothetical protein PK35_08855 [Tamlana nanhaiensis]|uniref:Uncharacterized protein n=1 Tax=Neotamlana nanhaiensis TaxID=1382798 RepID=A0A0D7W1Z2_9FLAO|nr:hypothetical protein [Tamlana nanhaiensis]KJD33064.1 hypothetical protein PK35_08855 [Tamlana nanhaiensis]
MRKLFIYLFSLSLLCFWTCDDGDIIEFEFDFEEEFDYCEGVDDLVLYKTKSEPAESMSLLISNFTLDDLIAVEENDTLIITNQAASFTYRTYNNSTISNIFCSDVPANVSINVDETDPVIIDILTVLTEDDNDGIPAILEDRNGNGDLTDDDTDGDGLPDYIDADDDGDNILTINENPDPNEDGDLSDAQDTDGDGTPDYLDDDDDGDGVLTRDEENDSQDQNPANDITDGTTADFLNDVIKTKVDATAYRRHSYTRTFRVSVIVKEIGINVISQDTLDFGYMNIGPNTTNITPQFN